MAAFGKPLDDISRDYLLHTGLNYARPVGCLQWIWCQWLLNGEASLVRERIATFVEDCMMRRSLSPMFHDRPRHDLLLLHCAIFASPKEQLVRLAEQIIDATGFRGESPRNDGNLYASAWCGAFKYWILGEFTKAEQQAELIWESYRPPWLKAASKPLATPWLDRDWEKFVKAQEKDFERLWESGKKNGTVRKKTKSSAVVAIRRYPVEQLWCWAHCGMALLAHRQGVQVATDTFWFPPHALDCVP